MAADEFLNATSRAIQLALADVNRLIDSVNLDDPDEARDALQAEMPALVVQWGEVAAGVAAEYFEELIGEPAVLADPPAAEVVEASVGWAVGPLFEKLVPRLKDDGTPVLDESGTPVVDKVEPDPTKARRNIQGSMTRHIQDQGRNTIRGSAGSTRGVGWARVLQGEEDCAWCVTMAGRGAVFSSEEAASMVNRNDPVTAAAHLTHDWCDCRIIPIRNDSDWPEGYDREKYFNMYETAYKRAGVKSLKGGKDARGIGLENIPDEEKDILQIMRESYGLH